jgi:hypothetical protein
MMKGKRKWIMVACAVCMGYLGAYAYARLTHRIVHFQNRSGQQPEVVARPDAWDDLLVDMSTGKPVMEAYAHGRRRAPGFLNAVFWPLRSIEAAWWHSKQN